MRYWATESELCFLQSKKFEVILVYNAEEDYRLNRKSVLIISNWAIIVISMSFVKFKPWYCGEQGIENNTKMVILNDELEIEYTWFPEMAKQNCSWGSVWWTVDQSVCISILTLPPLYLCYCSKRVNTCLYTVSLRRNSRSYKI